MQLVTMGEAVCGIVSDNGYPFLVFTEAAFQLNGEPENTPTLQLEPHTQGIVSVQKAVKFDFPHTCILQV